MASSLSAFLHGVRSRPLLESGREIELAREAAAGADDAFRQLVVSNLPWVIRIAREYSDRGVPFEDLLHDGIIGLLRATRRFDPDRGTRLLTYASPWIRKTILESLSRHAIIRATRTDADARRDGADGRAGAPRPRIVGIDDGDRANPSLPLADRLRDDDSPHGETEVLRTEAASRVRQALGRLTPRERCIVVWRHGLEDGERLSLDRIGSILGLSRERVRQIEARALEKMRRGFWGPPPSRRNADRRGPARSLRGKPDRPTIGA